MARLLLSLVTLLAAAPGAPASAPAPPVLYAVRYESVERSPDIVRTEVYEASPASGEHRLVFSDEAAPVLVLATHAYGPPAVTGAGGRVFAHAVERRHRPGRWYPSPGTVYELALDGSGRVRKVAKVLGAQARIELLVDPAGARVGYLSRLASRPLLFVHDAGTGALARRADVGPLFLECVPASLGWLPDGRRLFLTLDAGPEGLMTDEAYRRVGSYVLDEDGTVAARLPDRLLDLPAQPGLSRLGASPRLVGALPGGTYLVQQVLVGRGAAGRLPTTVLYRIDPGSGTRAEIRLDAALGLDQLTLSRSGRYLAFTSRSPDREVLQLWVKDLELGTEIRLAVLPKTGVPGFTRYLGVVGWREP